MSDARREAETALAAYEKAPEIPKCHICKQDMGCHYSGPDGTRWYCGNYFGSVKERDHFNASAYFRPRADHSATLADALRALLAAEPKEGEMRMLHFVFTDFPGPGDECVFVECNDDSGKSVNAGEWQRRPDGLVELLVPQIIAPVPAPAAVPDEVREAAERANKAMRDVFGGVDQIGDYCGHTLMPGKLAYAVSDLLAALAQRGEGRGE